MINGAVAVLLWADDQMCHMPQWFVNIQECQLSLLLFPPFFFLLYTADAISWDNWCTSNLPYKWQNIRSLVFLMNCRGGIFISSFIPAELQRSRQSGVNFCARLSLEFVLILATWNNRSVIFLVSRNIQGLSHWPCDVWMTCKFMFCNLKPEIRGAGGSEVCKETFVAVACGRVVQDRPEFPSLAKTCLSAGAVHLFITRRSTSTVLCWSCKLPVPTRRISQAVSNHSLCLDCSHLDRLLCSELAQGRGCNRMREVSRQMLLHKHIHLDLETTAVCVCRVRDGTLMPLGENVGVLLLAGANCPHSGGRLIYSRCVIDPFTGRQVRQDYAKFWRLVRDLSQAAIILKAN